MKPYNPTELMPESDIIRADIEHTRESMDHTLDEIGAKMKPRHLFDELLGFLRLNDANGEKLKECAAAAALTAGETVEHAAHAIGEAIRRHPLPTMLIGAGVAYSMYESRHHSHGRGKRFYVHQETADEFAESAGHGLKGRSAESFESAKAGIQSVKEKAKTAVANVGEHLHEKGHQLREHVAAEVHAIGEKASHLKDQVAESARRGYEVSRAKFVQTRQEHPLSVGLGFLAAGVLVGLVLPHSRKEDEWVGQAADRLKDRAKAKGEDLIERGKHVATAAADAVKKTAEQEGLTPDALLQKTEHVVSAAEQAAERSIEQTGLTPPHPAESNPPQPGSNFESASIAKANETPPNSGRSY